MKQNQLTKDAILLDPVGVEHVVESINTTTGADHSGWKYTLRVGKRKMKPLPYQAIKDYFTLKSKSK